MQYESLDGLVCSRDASLLEVIGLLQSNRLKILLIVDDSGALVGTITDGDVRRAILRGIRNELTAQQIMNASPVSFSDGLKKYSNDPREHELIPVLDDNHSPIGLIVKGSVAFAKPNRVLLMAGGRGTRLMPYTRDIPKPLVEINGESLIESLIRRFAGSGYFSFFVSVNHMAEQIIERLKDGKALGVEIEYLHESVPLGTAGALSFLRDRLQDDLLVANADLVTTCDFHSLLSFHTSRASAITIATRRYEHQIPFGVLDFNGDTVARLLEKPTWTAQVSTGIYALSPRVLSLVPDNVPTDMPDLISKVLDAGEVVSAFPLHEEWHDVGRPEDLERLRGEAH